MVPAGGIAEAVGCAWRRKIACKHEDLLQRSISHRGTLPNVNGPSNHKMLQYHCLQTENCRICTKKKNSCFCKPFGTKRKSLETKKNTVSTCGVASTRRSLNIGRVVYRLGGITAEKILYPTTFVSQKNLHFFCRFTIGPSTHLGCSFGARVPIAAHQHPWKDLLGARGVTCHGSD